VSQGDPTDHALAAIASILDKPEAKPPPLPREAVAEAVEERPAVEEQPLAPEQIEAEGYSKVGPGPIASIRFKWTARRAEDGDFYVDETIGDGAAKVTSGPMGRDAAIQFVNEREREARQRFENLRSEMTGRTAIAGLVRKDGSEA
jgi:hypothetical protein